MYASSAKKKAVKYSAKPRGKIGTRSSPGHPIHGTPRILILNSKPPKEDDDQAGETS